MTQIQLPTNYVNISRCTGSRNVEKIDFDDVDNFRRRNGVVTLFDEKYL